MAEEFNKDQFASIYPDGIENHYWNHARNKIVLKFLRKFGLHRMSILEIGGGRGVVTRFLHENRIDITGVELADVIPVEGTEGYFFSGADAFSFPIGQRKRFTVILLLDVIEHIKKPSEFIETIILHYPNLKHIVITVPARKELWTNYDEYNGHFMRYCLRDIKKIETEGIQLFSAGYFNHILYPVFWLYAKLFKSRETELRGPSGWHIAIHRVLSWVLQADYWLMPKSFPGTSIIALFHIQPRVFQK